GVVAERMNASVSPSANLTRIPRCACCTADATRWSMRGTTPLSRCDRGKLQSHRAALRAADEVFDCHALVSLRQYAAECGISNLISASHGARTRSASRVRTPAHLFEATTSRARWCGSRP